MTISQIKTLRLTSILALLASILSFVIDLRISLSVLISQLGEIFFMYFVARSMNEIIADKSQSRGVYFMSFVRDMMIPTFVLLLSFLFDTYFIWWVSLVWILTNKFIFMYYSYQVEL